MLQRIIIHLSLVLLFAFTQMGVATHAVSHIADSHGQHHQDQSNHEDQCGQCLSLSHLAGADIVDTVSFSFAPAEHVLSANISPSFSTATRLLYSARGPPSNSQV